MISCEANNLSLPGVNRPEGELYRPKVELPLPYKALSIAWLLIQIDQNKAAQISER